MEASYGTCIPIIRYSHAVNMLAEGKTTNGPFCQTKCTLISKGRQAACLNQ
jgi:hypothetical protein